MMYGDNSVEVPNVIAERKPDKCRCMCVCVTADNDITISISAVNRVLKDSYNEFCVVVYYSWKS